MNPPRSHQRIRQLIDEGVIPTVDASEVLQGVSTRYKYLIKVEDFERFVLIDRKPGPRPGKVSRRKGLAEAASS